MNLKRLNRGSLFIIAKSFCHHSVTFYPGALKKCKIKFRFAASKHQDL